MPRYIVRPTQSAQSRATSGEEGGGGTVVYTDTASKARELGAAKLGKAPNQVEVYEHDDPAAVFGADEPLTQEEAAAIWNQGAAIVEGSWESA